MKTDKLTYTQMFNQMAECCHPGFPGCPDSVLELFPICEEYANKSIRQAVQLADVLETLTKVFKIKALGMAEQAKDLQSEIKSEIDEMSMQ